MKKKPSSIKQVIRVHPLTCPIVYMGTTPGPICLKGIILSATF